MNVSELFIRRPHGVDPTARALELEPKIDQILALTRDAMMTEADFDPAKMELFMERVFNKHLMVISQRFSEAFARALPDLPFEERMWRMHFMAGAMTHTLLWSKILPMITGGACDVSDRQALVARAVTFLSAGFRAPAAVESAMERN